jgi:hypothetical protein
VKYCGSTSLKNEYTLINEGQEFLLSCKRADSIGKGRVNGEGKGG